MAADGNYVTVAEVRAEGVPATISDDIISLRIKKWEAIIERLTGQVYYVISPGELEFEGNNSDILHFNLPLIAVTSLRVNNDTDAMSADEYRVFNGRRPPQDDRQNPKIMLTGLRSNSLYTKHHGMFQQGMSQYVTATWGYVDDDPDNPGSFITPPPIQDCVKQMVTLELNGYYESGGGVAMIPTTPLRRERTDAHEVEYQLVRDARVTWSMLPKHIADTLALYRGPIQVTSPDNRYFAGYVTIMPQVI